MGQRSQPVTCKRWNGQGRRERAAEEVRFCWLGGRHGLWLCAEHARQFHAAMWSWLPFTTVCGGHDEFRVDPPTRPAAAGAECGRCPAPASQALRFCYRQERLELSLCEVHARECELDVLPWSRLASDLIGGHVEQERPAVDPTRREYGPVVVPEVLRQIPAEPESQIKPGVAAWVGGLPTVAGQALDAAAVWEWELTWHAGMRALQRGIDVARVREAVERPEVVVPSTSQPGVCVHRLGDLKVVVNPDEKKIITVCWRDEDPDDPSAVSPAAK